MLGALCEYIATAPEKHFQPMKSIFGILPPLEARPRTRMERGQAYADRGRLDLEAFLATAGNENGSGA
jgi:methylenetetrahydrofolate--tRNA-(uracil-5-)-methyltransferase